MCRDGAHYFAEDQEQCFCRQTSRADFAAFLPVGYLTRVYPARSATISSIEPPAAGDADERTNEGPDRQQ